ELVERLAAATAAAQQDLDRDQALELGVDRGAIEAADRGDDRGGELAAGDRGDVSDRGGGRAELVQPRGERVAQAARDLAGATELEGGAHQLLGEQRHAAAALGDRRSLAGRQRAP